MGTRLTGGCLCGTVRYECIHQAGKIVVCHCEDCHRAGGTGAAHLVRVSAETLVFHQGEPHSYTKRADSGTMITHYPSGLRLTAVQRAGEPAAVSRRPRRHAG